MESMNISSYLRQDDFNESTEAPSDNAGDDIYFANVAILVVCVLGLPGNLLVVTVYLRQQTTSTRVYMLSLALADMLACVSVIILSSTPKSFVALYGLVFMGDVATGFSAMLLAFISTERLVAVRRPLTFSSGSLRAKKAVVRLAVFDVVVIAVFDVARHTCCPLFGRIIAMIVLCGSVLIMIMCYFLVTVTLLKIARTARTNVGVGLRVTLPSAGTFAVTVTTHVDTVPHTNPKTPVTSNQSSKSTSESQTINYKNVYLLFTVTVVFIVSWLPLWLAYGGLPVPRNVQQIFLVNSAVNPFIYSLMSAMFRNDLRMFSRKTCSRVVNCLR